MTEQKNTLLPLDKNMRNMLFIASMLVFIIGISLYFFSEQTAAYFAWTINPPLTAAFLGAGYLASFIIEFLSAREKTWVRARIAVPAVTVFTFLTLIVTLIHLDKFHLNSPQFITVGITWVWIAVYASVPIIMSWLLVKQMQKTSIEPARIAPLSRIIQIILYMQGIS
ncbi:MAG: hypothetical protein GPJ54_17065, partial [Candidatus Heimdallarchaeota archaeon]|nr:hypothetical protein [Candidatus Heimdallarchaeota archaeon]